MFSGVAAVSYAATGDWKNAAIMGAGIALAAVGAGAAAVVATRAVKAAQLAVKADKAINDADDLANTARGIDQAAADAGDASQAADIAEQTKPTEPDPVNEPVRGETCANSFTPDTPVLLADGTSTPITNITIGDEVQSTDPTTGITLAEPVTQLHDNHDLDLTDLTITTTNTTTGATSSSVLHTTTQHPIWDATTKTWTNAGKLQPGDHLTTTTPGETVTVTAIHTRTGAHDMRNLTINATHTYYVLVGHTPILVHNISATCPVHGFSRDPSLDESHCTCGQDPPLILRRDATKSLEHADEINQRRSQIEAPRRAENQALTSATSHTPDHGTAVVMAAVIAAKYAKVLIRRGVGVLVRRFS